MESNQEHESQSREPPSFRDSGGTVYRLRITCRDAGRIAESTGFDIEDPEQIGKVYSQMTGSRELVKALWILIAEQAELENVSLDDFRGRMGGEELGDAWSAFVQAIVNFTPPQRRAAVEAIIEKTGEATGQAVEIMAREIKGTIFDNRIKGGIDEILRDMRRGKDSPRPVSPNSK